MLISIEGNIGSGKSTILNILKLKYANNPHIIFLDEPVNEWDTITDTNTNQSILQLFYQDKHKYAFTFQILTYITRLRKILQVLETNTNKIIITERSIYTDKFVFAKMLYQQKLINEIEWKTYNYWFDTFRKQTKLDHIIYINTSPQNCSNRIKIRNRKGESDISITYLQHCHTLHQQWLTNHNNTNITILDGNIDKSILYTDPYLTPIYSLLNT